MKRGLLGISAILSAAILSFSGVSATSVVDYEKSIGQVDGADTVNWVVEATDDGGYVVGGQTILCYKVTSATPEVSSVGKIKAFSYADDDDVEVAPFSDCLKYYQDHGRIDAWNYYPGMMPSVHAQADDGQKGAAASGNEFITNVSKTMIAQVCQFGEAEADDLLDDDDDSDVEISYAASCIDYIAKFKTNGVKEWLTTVEDSQRPVAVKKIGNNYRMMTNHGMVYNFSSSGVKGENDYINTNNGTIAKAFFNNDGSSVVLVGHQFMGGSLAAYSADGTLVRAESQQDYYYYDLFPTNDGYISQRYASGSASQLAPEIVDISNDLSSIKARSMNVESGKGVFVLSADRSGNIIGGIYSLNTETTEMNVITGFDKNGGVIGEYNLGSINPDSIKGFKDFTIGFVDGASSLETARLTKIISFNSDMSVKYEYAGGGDEFVADVARLRDDSLAGVGLALQGSSKIPVTGEANGGYLRLTATAAPNQPAQKPANTPNVKNPNTFDGIDVVALIGGLGLLGLGVFLRKNMARR